MNKKILLSIMTVFVLIFPASAFSTELEQPLVSNYFYDTYILDALSDMSAQTGVTIIADSTVAGFVTIELTDVPLEKALQLVLMSGGYSYVKIDDFYFVGAPDPKSPSFYLIAKTESFKIQYLSVASIKELLPAIYEQYVKINGTSNMLTITAPKNIIERFREDLKKIDIPSKSVKIQVVVTEVSEGVMKELGLESVEYEFDASESFNENWITVLKLALGTFDLEADFFGTLLAKIKLLENDQEAEITANPWIIVNDRMPASLYVGERQVVVLEAEGATSRIESIDAGVSLDVTPKIVGDDEIELTISPKISSFSGDRLNGLLVRRNELTTTIYAKSGQTLMISGITIEKKSEGFQGIPLLSKIPLLRYLFGVGSEDDNKRELLIFITPTIL
ncbi:type II secretion system protein GspD [Mesotoga sp.]|uniref:type II secretion system protein GspD n=1 Tax=Mesotoga sp. TaxID=2053577 RepID=UPI00345E295C